MDDYYTVYDLKINVDSYLHSGGVSSLQNWQHTVDLGRQALISKVRPQELVRKSYLEDALFSHVDKYAAPTGMKYDDVIELKLLPAYRNIDTMEQPGMLVYSRRFGQKRGGARNVLSIFWENGVKYANVFRPRGLKKGCEHVLIHNCDSLSDNGTWNVGGNVVNLRLDELNHVQGRGAIAFDINNSATTGFVENFTLNPFDIHDFFQTGAQFSWLSLSLPKEMLAVKLYMGSDSSDLTTDYYFSSVNQPHDNTVFLTGWNLLKYMMNAVSMVGTPNPRALTWIRLEFTTTGVAIPNCHIDNLIMRKGAVYEIRFNGRFIFMDANTRAFKKFTTSDSDIIIAEEDTYQALTLETTLAAQKEIYGNNFGAQSDVTDVKSELKLLYEEYKREHKSEAMLEGDSIHVFGNYLEDLSDVPMDGYGDRWGQWENGGGNMGNGN